MSKRTLRCDVLSKLLGYVGSILLYDHWLFHYLSFSGSPRNLAVSKFVLLSFSNCTDILGACFCSL